MKIKNSSLVALTTLGAVFLTTACSSIPKTAHQQALSTQEQQFQQELVDQRANFEKEIKALKTENSTVAKRAAQAEANASSGSARSEVVAAVNTELFKEASTKIVPVAPTYKTVTERVMVRPAHTHLKTIPAKYETISNRVLDKAAHTVWKRGAGFQSSALETRIDNGTGEIMCLVEVPATYKTVTKTILKTPETVVEEQHDAEYETITRRVLDKPATTKTVVVPAEYKVVNVQRLVTPEKEVRKAIPAVYKNVTSSEKVSDEVLAWEEVLCENG